MSKKLFKLISTFFYLGCFPFIPGTMGSFAGVLVYLFVADFLTAYAVMTIYILILGFAVCSQAEKLFERNDPPEVVIDEVCGMLIALFSLPKTWPIIFCAFFLFRGFDTIKPWPIDKLEKVPFGAGIMLDDIMAGVYTNLVMRIALLLAPLA
ncbi:MAG: phosphatidylglycerophosphatase A [Candidatus Omnitrophota bacterium]|nr:phosphatidylglycerophosphatase A [Candidatus Omnitrophota bacterium]